MPRGRKLVWGVAVAIGVVIVTLVMSLGRTQGGTIELATVAVDTVRRGDFARTVRAPGTLVPEHTRIIVATTGGRVEALPVRPGEIVSASTTIVRLSNPDVELAELQMQQQLLQASAALAQFETTIADQRSSHAGALAQLRSQYLEALRNESVFDTLASRRVASPNEVLAARERAAEMRARYALEQGQIASIEKTAVEQRRFLRQQVDGVAEILKKQRERVASMRVTPVEAGQLQSLGNPTLELGQWVNSGIELARVAPVGRLKALLRVPDAMAKDVTSGQPVAVDTREGVVSGHVSRVDPIAQAGSVTIEVALDSPLPKGARSDMSVDGTITLETLRDVLYIRRPDARTTEGRLALFRIRAGERRADKVPVTLGRSSVSYVEVRDGLRRGDVVILSAFPEAESVSSIRLR